MAQYDGSGSGIYILQVTPSGATPIAAEGYPAATGATGAGGLYAASGFKFVDDFFFAHTTNADHLLSGNPTNISLATGTGKLLGQDIRGSGIGYQVWGTTTPTGLPPQVEYFVGAYATYTDASSKTLTGLISGYNGFYTGSYTTFPLLYEFDTVTPQTGENLAYTATGSGVHLYKDVTLTFTDIIDRQGESLITEEQLQNSLFFDGINIDILDSTGGMVFTGYKSGVKSRTFNFTEQDNIAVFGDYEPDFGVRYAVQDQNGSEQRNEFYVYANPLEIECVYVTDASGRFLNESNASNYVTTGTTAEELYLTNQQQITGLGGEPVGGVTGMVELEICFKNDPQFTNFGDTVNLYGKSGEPTGENDPASGKGVSSPTLTHFRESQDTFMAQFKPLQDKVFKTSIGTDDLVPPDRNAAYLAVGHSMGKKIMTPLKFEGKLETPPMDPDNAGHPLFNVGNQYIWDGSLEIEGCVVAECLTIQTVDYPCTLKTAGDGKVGINTCDPTYPLTVTTNATNNRGIALFDHGDPDNPVITLNGSANEDGDLTIYNNAGEITSQLFNDSDNGKFWLKKADGAKVTEVYVDGAGNGVVNVLDSATNSSVKLSSDSSIGNVGIYDAGGTLRVEMKGGDATDPNEGSVSIKDSLGNVATKVQAHKSVISAQYSNIYSTGSVIIGGSGHVISGDYDVIAGGAANQISGISGDFNFIGGGSGIDIEESTYASSVGGLNNDIITGDYSVIAGGAANMISGGDTIVAGQQEGVFNFIGGGSGIDIRESLYCCSVGGYDNDVKGTAVGVIGGGSSNRIEGELTADSSTTVGSFIGGGAINRILASHSSTIAGGVANLITGGGGSFIGGGQLNKITGLHSSLLAGTNNDVYSNYSTIGGGQHNEISGVDYAFIGGGHGNKVSGQYSYAFGHNALVTSGHSGAAVLADGQDRTHASSGENTLNLDFASGVYIGGGGALYVSGNPVMTGSHTVEADTLQTVTARGATTNQAISITNTSTSALAIATDALVVDGSNDRVGIGTATSMQSKLDVFGNISVGSNGSYAGSTSAPSDGMIIQGNVGIGCTSPYNKLDVAAGMVVGSSYAESNTAPSNGLLVEGNVGVGTYSASTKLDVNGNAIIGASFMGYSAPANGLAVAGNIGIGTYSAGNALDIYGAALIGQNYSAGGYTAPSNGMIVEGNVGVGTSSPKTALDVRGTISGYTGLFDDKVGIGTNSPRAELDVARDTDVSGIIGRAQIGYAGDSDVASFAHVDFANATDFAFAQTSAGHSVINARDGYNIYVREGDANIAVFDGSTKDFYVDTDTLYVDASEDNVGINTSAPTHELDVRGTISGYSGFFSGMVQIGQTGHYSHVPTELLEVQPNDDVSAEIGQAHVGYVGHSNYAGFSHIDRNSTTDYALLQASAGSTYLNSKASQNIYFNQGGSTKGGFNTSSDFYVDTNTLYVDASEDRVGINEASPSYTLDVTASDASSLLSRFYNSSSTNGQGLLVRAGETSNANRIFQCSSRDDTKVMTVNSNGRVGIGADTTPDYNLDLGGDTSSTSNTFRINQNNGGTAIRVGAGGGSSDVTLLRVDGESTAHNGESDKSKYGFSLNYMGARSSNANSLSVFCDDGGAANQVEGVTITQSGQVGILSTGISNYSSDDMALQVGGPAEVMGHFAATSKSFVIDHPTKENKKLQYGSLEGPEHAVFVRGTTNKNVIKLPDYWKDLVHEDSITVTLTPVHTFQSLYVKSKTPEQIMVGGVKKSYDYVVYGERKDIDKLEVEI